MSKQVRYATDGKNWYTVGEGRHLRLARNMIRRYERATSDRKAKLHKRYEHAVGVILAAQLRKD